MGYESGNLDFEGYEGEDFGSDSGADEIDVLFGRYTDGERPVNGREASAVLKQDNPLNISSSRIEAEAE